MSREVIHKISFGEPLKVIVAGVVIYYLIIGIANAITFDHVMDDLIRVCSERGEFYYDRKKWNCSVAGPEEMK